MMENKDTNDLQVANNDLPCDDKNIKSVDIYNALNLYNEQLGASYKNEGYNPFDDNFVLTEEYICDILENKKTNKDIFPEAFLEYGNKEFKKYFLNAIENSNQILDELNKEFLNNENETDKQQIKKAIVFLKNRNELLKININKLKQKDANALKMYMELYGLDGELSELLKDTFNEKANNHIIVQNMINALRFRAKRIYTKSQKTTDPDKSIEPTPQEQQIKESINKNETKTTQQQPKINKTELLSKKPVKIKNTQKQEEELSR